VHLLSPSPTSQANRDPRMGAAYSTYLRGLAANNVSLITHFTNYGAFSK
jgi:hypothetical protein